MKHLLAAFFIATSLCFNGWADEAKDVAKAEKTVPIYTKKTVRELATLLGHKSFKKRRYAQKQLLAIGRGECTRSDKRIEMRELVLDVLEDFRTHKDPEVSYRARKIIAALTPHPPSTSHLRCDRW